MKKLKILQFKKGETDVIHIYMSKGENLKRKVAAKAELRGEKLVEFIIKVLEKNVEEIDFKILKDIQVLEKNSGKEGEKRGD